MAEKIVRLGIQREPGYIYFIRDTEIYRAPIKGANKQERAQKVCSGGFCREPGYLYFLDATGDVSRAPNAGVRGKVDEDESEEAEDVPRLFGIAPNRSLCRHLLEALDRDALSRLCEIRELQSARSNDDMRARIARSYRGDVDALLHDLRRSDLVDLLREGFIWREKHYRLKSVTRADHESLLRICRAMFVDGTIHTLLGEVDEDEDGDEEDEDDEDEDEDDDEDDQDDDEDDQDEVDEDEEDEDELADLIANVLRETPGLSARQLESRLKQREDVDVSKSAINSVLYTYRDRFRPDEEQPPCWSLNSDEWDEDTDVGSGNEREDEDDASGDDADASASGLTAEIGTEWGRPRKLTSLMRRLGMNVPQRLHTRYFQEIMQRLLDHGIEVQHIDGAILSAQDSSPGISTKVRLRRASRNDLGERAGTETNITIKPGGEGSRLSGQGHVVAGTDFELAHLRLQFLTAVPSLERPQRSDWPDGFLTAAQRGLSLGQHHQQLLSKIASTYGRGTHDPYAVVVQLASRTRGSDWPVLLSDFAKLNSHLPEVVDEVLRQVRDLCGATLETRSPESFAPVAPRSFVAPAPVVGPTVVSQEARGPGRSPRSADGGGPNHRDLGALSKMFDDE